MRSRPSKKYNTDNRNWDYMRPPAEQAMVYYLANERGQIGDDYFPTSMAALVAARDLKLEGFWWVETVKGNE